MIVDDVWFWWVSGGLRPLGPFKLIQKIWKLHFLVRANICVWIDEMNVDEDKKTMVAVSVSVKRMLLISFSWQYNAITFICLLSLLFSIPIIEVLVNQ